VKRYYYGDSTSNFLGAKESEIIGELASNSEFADELTQKEAWRQQIQILKNELSGIEGHILFEYSIPRMGRRIDAVLIVKHVVFVLEFKVGESDFLSANIDQVWDYALDLKYFHEPSRDALISPILIATMAKAQQTELLHSKHNDNVLNPLKANTRNFKSILSLVLESTEGIDIDPIEWSNGKYSPSPTIIEAAISLFNNHSVEDISRSDASAEELFSTNQAITDIINITKQSGEKAICFLTGVPGSGKTLIGLSIATKQMEEQKTESSVFLSGNGPLVAILRESLTRNKIAKEREAGRKTKKGEVLRSVKAFIQNVHHFRDEGLVEPDKPPADHVAIFDEAQRAWDLTQTANFMSRKKKIQNFAHSEPDFLISCLDRHDDWAVIVCLVGGGQEINVGEAGISEWIKSLTQSFPHWNVFVSSKLTDSEYAAGQALSLFANRDKVVYLDKLHLSVSMRSFRAENLSLLVKNILDLNPTEASIHYNVLKDKYPIAITREVPKARKWLREMARGSERYGIVVSSQAYRLKPHAIDVQSPMDPVHWFLNDKSDIRSSYYLEQVATEFDVQGLELDWACVTWDGDFRYSDQGWKTFKFIGSDWQRIIKEERKTYLKNAYRVLLTRARQGMIIVVPYGDETDTTRSPAYYDATYNYLRDIGFQTI
jgi:hypothetical protein